MDLDAYLMSLIRGAIQDYWLFYLAGCILSGLTAFGLIKSGSGNSNGDFSFFLSFTLCSWLGLFLMIAASIVFILGAIIEKLMELFNIRPPNLF